ncbi:ABC transporter permease [Candidatus Bipolaricaulota bacterium]
MLVYLIRRTLQMFMTLFVASLVVYGAMQLVPGDPVVAMFFPNIPSAERLESIREELGLNQPFLVRYIRWLGGALRGDLGESYKQYRPVTDIMKQTIPPTIALALAGLLVSLFIGIPVGVLAGITEKEWVDNSVMVIALIGVSAPSFWLGLLLMLVFSLYLGWFPSFGVGGIAKLVLPALTLGLYGGGYLARFARSSVLEIKYLDYVTTARAKGISELRVTMNHVLRNALIPVITMSGMLAGYMLGGAVIVETVFGRSGVGNMLVRSISDKDYPLVQALLFFTVAVFILMNLAVDVSYAYIDPRIRYD